MSGVEDEWRGEQELQAKQSLEKGQEEEEEQQEERSGWRRKRGALRGGG